MLPNEEEQDDLAAVLRESYATSELPGEFAAQLHERLQCELAELQQPQVRRADDVRPEREAKSVWKRMNQWMGGFTMRQRIAAVGGVSVAALLGLVLLWGAMNTRPVSAMEKMAASVRRATSCKCTVVNDGTVTVKLDGVAEPSKHKMHGEIISYWSHPGKRREEYVDSIADSPTEPYLTKIYPGIGQPRLVISHRAKTFRFLPSDGQGWQREKEFTPEMLADLAGKADRELGAKEVNGKQAWGFCISSNKIDRRIQPKFQWEIWVDSETNLPVLLRSETATETFTNVTEVTGFQWNIELDPAQFEAKPPEGFRDLTWRAPASGAPVKEIVEAERATQGRHFRMPERPCRKDVEVQLMTVEGFLTEPDQRQDWMTEELFERMWEQREGLLYLWAIAGEDRDVAYYGKTAGPDAKDEVLLRWKLDDGQYQVIFGDLRDEVVTAERLRILERD